MTNYTAKEETYLKDRLEDQIQWYSNKSTRYKRWFYGMSVAEITLAIIIPVLFHYSKTEDIAPLLSPVVAILAGLLALFKFQENWISYRTTSESLKHEKHRYFAKAKPYDKEDAFNMLVDTVESIISKENTLWKQTHSLKKQKEVSDD